MCGLGHSHGPAFGGRGTGQKQVQYPYVAVHSWVVNGAQLGGQWRGKDLREVVPRHTGHAMP